MEYQSTANWSLARKISFRFFSIIFILFTSPWLWFDQLPGVSFITRFYYSFDLWWVNLLNKYLLHVKDVLNTNGYGSGDTTYAWAQLYSYIIASVAGSLLWSVLDRKRINYVTLDFWLRNIVRYFVSMVSFSYGIIKLFALQMPFPNLSQLATPLGDYLPMRLSWMFLGYSPPYQIFSGVMETTVAILLLNRRTVTVGALMGVGVFAHVLMLNLSYDIPVKLYASQLLFCCLFLALNDWKRVAGFFLLNKQVEPDRSFEIELNKRWKTIGRIVWKVAFVIMFALMPFFDSWSRYKDLSKIDSNPIRQGVYDVKYFVRTNDTIPPLSNDSIVWKDVIFDKNGLGSVNSLDTLFRQRYRRGYFLYTPDSTRHTIAFKKTLADTIPIFTMRYELSDEKKKIKLWGKIRNDSVRVELLKSKRHFQLAERQFHWVSEANR